MKRGLSALLAVMLTWHWASLQAAGLSLEAESEAGKYRIILATEFEPVPVRKLHSWTITVRDESGNPFIPRQLAFYGGMPGHGHGLPSEPQVTQQLEEGTYLVEGVLFNMFGAWELVVGVYGPAGPDKAVFPLTLRPKSVASETLPAIGWDANALALMQSLRLPQDTRAPLDPTNRFDGRPEAIALGEKLFFDPGLSGTGEISCASCHLPELKFTDGVPTSIGTLQMQRNSPTLLGVAHADWFYWDGRRDSLWAQALTPLETLGEMDTSRAAAVRYVREHPDYGAVFAGLSNASAAQTDAAPLPENAGPYGTPSERAAWSRLSEPQHKRINRAFSDIGKIIAAYVATLQPRDGRFDRFVDALAAGKADVADRLMSASEQAGLRLYLDAAKTQCLRCHNGPHFTNFGFHNIGTGMDEQGNRDFGRLFGIRAAQVDEFNCLGAYSDGTQESCDKHRFGGAGHDADGAFKVPGLRNVALTGPYMHDGSLESLGEVLRFYREPPDVELTGHELPPLTLTDQELADLEAFLHTLNDSSDAAAVTTPRGVENPYTAADE